MRSRRRSASGQTVKIDNPCHAGDPLKHGLTIISDNPLKAGGIEGLLKPKSSPGRPRSIPKWAEKALDKRLQEPLGFNGYQEIVEWLEQNLGVNTCYKTVHKLVYYRLKSYPKVPRSKSVEQSEAQVEAFKKTLHRT